MGTSGTSVRDEAGRRHDRDLQVARRREHKEAAVRLAAHLEAYGARTRLGRCTPSRAVVVVRQERRTKTAVAVRVADDGEPVYRVERGAAAPAGPARAGDGELYDVDAVRRAVLAPPSRWWRVGAVALHLVLWALVAIGVGVLTDLGEAWWVLVALGAVGAVASLLTARAAGQVRRRRRELAALARLRA
ncbi:hypothetical protein [Puerhibacterium puerhi]|uniref:hypothetical protein n=1 Tax=Puerhibacterium puerhi TaxID=2692623 RepID=UPI00135CD0FA|nr:hypothetical protein [Puerhibacterium puerhi]